MDEDGSFTIVEFSFNEFECIRGNLSSMASGLLRYWLFRYGCPISCRSDQTEYANNQAKNTNVRTKNIATLHKTLRNVSEEWTTLTMLVTAQSTNQLHT